MGCVDRAGFRVVGVCVQLVCGVSLYSMRDPVCVCAHVGEVFSGLCLCLLVEYESGHMAFAGLCVTISVCQCLEGVCASLCCVSLCVLGGCLRAFRWGLGVALCIILFGV